MSAVRQWRIDYVQSTDALKVGTINGFTEHYNLTEYETEAELYDFVINPTIEKLCNSTRPLIDLRISLINKVAVPRYKRGNTLLGYALLKIVKNFEMPKTYGPLFPFSENKRGN